MQSRSFVVHIFWAKIRLGKQTFKLFPIYIICLIFYYIIYLIFH